MTRNIRKVVSIVCAVALLLSLCAVSLTGVGQAFKVTDTPVGGALKLTFDGNKGVSDTSTKNTCGYDVDPADQSNAVFRLTTDSSNSPNLEVGKDANVSAYNGADAFTLQPDTQYVIAFKYKFAKGSHRKSNSLDIKLYTGQQSPWIPGLSKTELLCESVTMTAENGTIDGKGRYVLNADTEWLPFKYVLYTDSKVTNDNLYITLPNDQSGDIGKVTCYIDDFTIDIVDEDAGSGEDFSNHFVFNYRNDTTGEVWAPNNHKVLANSNKGLSYVDAAGLHFTGSHSSAIDSSDAWRHVCGVYDVDNGGFLQFKDKAMYAVTVKYKFESFSSASSARLAIARSGKYGNATFNKDPASFGPDNQHTLAPLAWSDEVRAPQSEWQYLTAVVNGSEVSRSWLYLTMSTDSSGKAATALIESVTVSEVKNSEKGAAAISFNTGSGNFTYPMVVTAGSPVTLPTPTTDTESVAFGGWYFDAELTEPVGADYAPKAGSVTLYAMWSKDFVKVTTNNAGTITTTTMARGTVLQRPLRPNSKMFFEGWYTNLNFTHKVTEVPGDDCTLYAKYTHNYIGFNNGGISDKTDAKIKIVDDPDDANNKVLLLTTQHSGSWNFELAGYDAAGAKAYQLPKTNTTYFISFKYKVKAGSCGGNIQVYTGEQSAYSGDHSKGSTGLNSSWDDKVGEKGTDWVTVSGYYTVGDNFYRERVNFSVQNQLYFVLDGRKEGKVNNGAPIIYVDDVVVGPVLTEAPEGAVTINYRTNGDEIEPSFGYPGEAYTAPEDPTLSAHKFLGWYTDKALKNEFTSKTFPNEDITLYAKWAMEDWVMDFDVYDNSGNFGRYSHITDTDNPYLYYNFEQGKAQSSSPASSLARFTLNRGSQDFYNCDKGVKYTIKFRYKVVEIEGSGNIVPILSLKNNTWGDSKDQSGGIAISAPCDWTNATIEFTANPMTDKTKCSYLSLGVSGDATYMFDDVTVIASVDNANVYGSVVYMLDTLGGPDLQPVSGDPGDPIELPTPTRAGYRFGGWYKESNLKEKFTDTVFGEEGGVLYAYWILGKFNESFEDLPTTIETQGISSAYTIYKNGTDGFDKANVHSGSTSLFRKGDAAGSKSFTICRNGDLALGVGSQYTMTFWVKPAKTGDPSGTINLIGMTSNTSVSAPDSTKTITTVGELKEGEWQQVTYTFTADKKYIGIQTTAGNDIYFDDFTVTLHGYTGSSTGDSSVSPLVILMMVVLAAGALTVTGKKIFD